VSLDADIRTLERAAQTDPGARERWFEALRRAGLPIPPCGRCRTVHTGLCPEVVRFLWPDPRDPEAAIEAAREERIDDYWRRADREVD